MEINWNDAPEWADSVRKTVVGNFYWCNDKQCLIFGYSKDSNPTSIVNEGQKGILRYFTINDLALVELRPDEWQEGEERMNNIAQNGNDGHYVEVPKTDNVNSPEHYQSEDGIECIDAIRAALGKDGFISHCRGTAIKYAWRSGKKANHAEDLRKAAWYLEKAASELDK